MISKRSKAKPSRRSTDPSGGGRIAALDALRGLAILLMVLDHVAGMLMDVRIEYTSVRFWTRLSMPLFCVLMGYFLDPGRPRSLHRFGQIALAAATINIAFFWLYHEVEILGSLLVAYTLFLLTGRAFVVFIAAAALYPVDPLTTWFDYPLTIVLSFVAQGMILRHWGGLPAAVSGCLLATGIAWIGMGQEGDVNHLLFYFILPATAAVHWASGSSAGKVPVLDWLGRHPLSSYLVQYYVIFAAYFWLKK